MNPSDYAPYVMTFTPRHDNTELFSMNMIPLSRPEVYCSGLRRSYRTTLALACSVIATSCITEPILVAFDAPTERPGVYSQLEEAVRDALKFSY